MKIGLMNFENKVTKEVNVDIDKVSKIFIAVVTGDEIMKVCNNNGNEVVYDSCKDGRTIDYFDGETCIYDKDECIDLIDKFIERRSPYNWLLMNS
jgi:hypothetical protein